MILTSDDVIIMQEGKKKLLENGLDIFASNYIQQQSPMMQIIVIHMQDMLNWFGVRYTVLYYVTCHNFQQKEV